MAIASTAHDAAVAAVEAATSGANSDGHSDGEAAEANVPLKYWMQRFRLFSRFGEGEGEGGHRCFCSQSEDAICLNPVGAHCYPHPSFF